MTDTRTKTAESARIRRYLLGELPRAEREEFEEKMFVEGDLFYQVAEAENDMVDRFVAGALTSAEKASFERSLDLMPARREKLRNSRVIHNFFVEERAANAGSKAAGRTAEIGLWSRMKEFLAVGQRTLGPAFAALSIVLLVAMGLLFWTNNSLRDENARLRAVGTDDWRSQERKLNEDLDASRKRESDLANRINAEGETTEDLASDLIKERETRKQLETEVAKLRRTASNTPETKPPGQTVQTLSLGNTSSHREELTPTVKLGNAARQMAILVRLPASVPADEVLSVKLNGQTIVTGIKPRADQDGGKHITVSVPVADLKAGVNKITVYNHAGAEIATHSFTAEK